MESQRAARPRVIVIIILASGCFALAACSASAPRPANSGGSAGTRSGGAPGADAAGGSGGAPGSGGAGTGGAGTGGLANGGSSAATGGQIGTGGAGGGWASGGASGAAGPGGAGGDRVVGGVGGQAGTAGTPGGGASGAAGGAGGSAGGVRCGAPTSTCTCSFGPPQADHPIPSDYDLTTAGTVLDKVTGLMWERTATGASSGPPCRDFVIGCAPQPIPRADETCAGSRTAGFTDWRLPTVPELISITDFEAHDPALNATVFPGTPAGYFWTGTADFRGSLPGQANAFWTVYTGDGTAANGSPNQINPLRCVRATRVASCFPDAERYQPSSISSVQSTIDRTTGLTWQRGRAPQRLTWAAAKDYCVSQGWRLPSVKELLSLADFDKVMAPAIDTTVFPDTPDEDFWTMTAAAGMARRAHKISFWSGSVYFAATDVANYVRCVR